MTTPINNWESRFDAEFCWQPPLGKKSIRFVRVENTKLSDPIELNGYEDQLVKDLKQFIAEQITLAKEEGAAEEKKRIVEIIQENHKGAFTDDRGNDCWYTDSLIELISKID